MSSLGRVCDTRGIVSYGSLHPSGYRSARIEGYSFFVHRLVAFQFLGPPPFEDTWQVNHKDHNRSNNQLDNLEYVTHRQNLLHAFAGKTLSGSPRPVKWRCSGSSQWMACESIQRAAQTLGFCPKTVSRYCHSAAAVKGLELCFADSMDVLDGEEWRQMRDPETGEDIPGRTVSSYGRIASRHGRISTGTLLKGGYRALTVYFSDGQKRNRLVHRLVAFAFFGEAPTPEHTQVNHKDLDKENNVVSNLEYATPSQNARHARANGERKPASTTKTVESRLYGSKEKWRWHPSVVNAANTLGLHRSLISACIRERRRSTGGFEFRPGRDVLLPSEQWRKVDVSALLRERVCRRG